MTRTRIVLMATVNVALLASSSFAVDYAAEERKRTYAPTTANLEARQWFQNAKFGMFIHWGVYSVLADGEWVMNNKNIPIAEYEKVPPQFNPTQFDADAWVALAKQAGMKYITITSKHHDGFAMFDSKVSDYDIIDRTPYKKDVLKMLAEACKKQDIKLFFYHSQLDWHHPDYFPLGNTGRATGRPEGGDWYKYLDYLDSQLRELLTNYGPIGGIWFDGWWDKPNADWRLQKTYQLIHDLQPAAMVGNNHHVKPFPGEDFQMFEKDLPGHNTTGFSAKAEVGVLPLETCETINGAWGYNANDKNFKSVQQLIGYLVRAAGYNANFLLNIGPKPDGTIQPEFVERLQAIGKWLDANGESLYSTRGGPFPPRPWGVSVNKNQKTVYLHILQWPGPELALPALDRTIAAARLFQGNDKVSFHQSDAGILLTIPEKAKNDTDTIVVLELAEPAKSN